MSFMLLKSFESSNIQHTFQGEHKLYVMEEKKT